MSPENTKKLLDIFPEAFADLDKRSCMALFGFECGDGWYDLLKEALIEIKAISDRNPGIDFKVAQIKEKFGTLRFYWDGKDYERETSEPDSIDLAIERAEARSAKECEKCGAQATTKRRGYWVYTQCDACDKIFATPCE
jgi:hypothetical protein